MKRNRLRILTALLLLLSLLCGCERESASAQTSSAARTSVSATVETSATPAVTTTAPSVTPSEPAVDADELIEEIRDLLDAGQCSDGNVEEILRYLADTYGTDVLLSLASRLKEASYYREVWYEVTGNSYFVLWDLATGDAERDGRIRLLSTGVPGAVNDTTVLTFGGDICLADNYLPMQYMAKNGLSITDCIDPVLVEQMQADDITFMNNEFTISDRGTPMAGKYYTFRAAVKNTALYNTLGVDIVSLANNHAYDYGTDAFLDTLDALEQYGVDAVGGGENLDEAMKPMYYIVNGRKIAYVAASRAEKYKLTPEATADSPGILRCYDTEKFLQVIREAEANSDLVIACVHWGTEYSAELEEAQVSTARDYIDAGADLIVGAHAHQLQGIEYYKGKAIFYNLGNFWFNDYDIGTGLLKVEILPDGSFRNTFLPALQTGCVTSYVGDEKKGGDILYWLRTHSDGVEIDADGVVTEVSDE
ncbi:MAG: CapA family protein [Clostridia bacterium]|nr:CapA family protein [Clostridia bacterium]